MDHKTKLALWSAANSVMSSLEALLQYKQHIDQQEIEEEEHEQAKHLSDENEINIINSGNESYDDNDGDDDYDMDDRIQIPNVVSAGDELHVTKKRKAENIRNNKELLEEYKLIGDTETPPIIDENTFQELFDYIEQDIIKEQSYLKCKRVSANERLGATLLYLMTGKSLLDITKATKISTSLLNNIIIETCDSIFQRLKDQYLKFPADEKEWKEISKQFQNTYQFPLCLGAIDAHHIVFTECEQIRTQFENTQGYTSIILITLTDANGKFIYVDAGGYGSLNINEAFLRTDLYKKLTEDKEKIPKEAYINDTRVLPHVMIANSGFPLLKNLMVPFELNRIHEQNTYFNNRLNNARNASLQAFHLMSKHFRILKETIHFNSAKTERIVLACCILHNFLKEKCAWYTSLKDENEEENLLEKMIIEKQYPEQEYSIDEEGEIIRADFSNYFYYENV